MKIITLKSDFVELATKSLETFFYKSTRPYLILMHVYGKDYLIPFRSKVTKGIYSYVFNNGKGLDFRSSFLLVNKSIIASTSSIPKDDYNNIMSNLGYIKSSYEKYIRINTYTEFEKEMIKLQNEYKGG